MPASHPHRRARRSRHRWSSVLRWLGLGLLGLVALVLLVAALVLPGYARSKTRELLQNSRDISGDFLDVETSLFPLS